MEIIVKIPDDMIKSLEQGSFGAKYNIYDLVGFLMNGTPLPKHHGRLIDESQIKHIECHTEQELYGTKIRYVKTTDAPTIIEGSDNECHIV